VLPLSARKIGFRFTPRDTSKSGKQDLLVELSGMQGEQAVRAEQNYNLNVKGPSENRKVTFLSHIDRSVQYYALNPARGNPSPTKRRALVLSVHGAGVQAMNQANAYSGKSWTHLVAATNRRPFGFDWEDWGRLDAMEVLAHSSRLLEFDPQRVYLTGHSMGGHGTWQLGAHFPDRFAAIGPSAGWISFSTYGRSSRSTVVAASAMDQLLERSRNASNTLLLSTNYTQQAIYIIHGTADRSVPVREARTMRDHLAGFHNHVMYHEQPDAGHWWGNSDEPGSECVDWPPMFDLFSRTRIPLAEEVRKINFTTVNPGLSSRCHWAEIFAQDQSMEPSNISLQWDPWKGRVFGTTQNVTELGLTVPLRFAETPITIELDGQTLTNRVDLASKHDPVLERKTSSSSEMRLIRTAENWGFATHEVVQRRKSPERSGSFKAAFTNSVILVYGTQGTENENQWSLAKARFDSETFWYRGNGSLETMSDLQYVDSLREGESDSGIRNVILYGNEDTNLAFSKLLETCPIKIKRGRIQIGDRELVGDQLGALLLWPNLESSKALVGVVGGTGITGLKMTDRLPYFVSGVAYPDWIVVEPDVLMEGNDAIVGAGFFDTDWLLSERDTVWK
jgi:poly(3-hydroxybutyrate) depolymerase